MTAAVNLMLVAQLMFIRSVSCDIVNMHEDHLYNGMGIAMDDVLLDHLQ